MANKIKKGDKVIVISGKDKGRTGQVLRCFPDDMVLVDGVNIVKKHVKPNPQKEQVGGIVERENKIHISNVALLNPLTQKPDRVGFRILEDGKKVRVYKSNSEQVDI